MTYRQENDAYLAEQVLAVERLAGSLDRVMRERGIRGVAEVAANITKANREVEWRCQQLEGPWWKKFL